MFTESNLRQHPAVIKAFMGLPAQAFWALSAQVKEKMRAYERQRLQSAARRRAIRGGRDFG